MMVILRWRRRARELLIIPDVKSGAHSIGPTRQRGLTGAEKNLLAPYIPSIDLEGTMLHFGRVPWYLPRRFQAIARGRHIFFRHGVCDTRTPEGIALLGHELVHVGQYRTGMTAASYLWSVIRGYRNSHYERSAYALQSRILRDLARS